VGSETRRIDALEKVTGDALFPADMKRSGLLVGKTLHSPIAHGRIRSIKTDKASSLPGVFRSHTGIGLP